MTAEALRSYRPEVREPRVFPVARFETDLLPGEELARHKDALAKVDLLDALLDGRPVVRANVARALSFGKALDAATCQRLGVLLRDGDAAVRVAAAHGLRNAADQTVAVVDLLEATVDSVPAVADAARETLRHYGAAALPVLVALLKRTPAWVDSRVLPALADLGPAASAALEPLVAGSDLLLAANALAVCDHYDEERLNEVTRALADRKGPGYDQMRERMRRTALRLERRKGKGGREPLLFPVAGFDTELLPREVLEQNKKALTLPFLRQALQDGRVAVRANALSALAIHGKLPAEDVLGVTVMLRDASPSVRAAAARALHQAADPGHVLPALVAAHDSSDAQVQAEVIAAVQSYGQAALPHLIPCLRVPGDVADVTILPVLATFGDNARESLQIALMHADARVRGNALAGLISLGDDALRQSRRKVADLFRDPEPEVQAMARQALGILNRADSPTYLEERPLPLDDFADQLADEAALKKAAKKLNTVALVALTRDGRALVRANAWRGLQAMGPLDAETALQAAVACKDGDRDVRREAALALRHCPESVLADVMRPLVSVAADPDRNVQQAARQAVFSQGKKAIPLLIELFADRLGPIHGAAVSLAVAMEGDAVPAVLAALESPQPLVREHALKALGEVGGKPLDDAFDKVLACLKDSHDGSRLQAVLALARMRPAVWKKRPDLDKLMVRTSREDPSLVVRQAAAGLAPKLQAAARA